MTVTTNIEAEAATREENNAALIFWPATHPDAQLELFTGEVVPAIRKQDL